MFIYANKKNWKRYLKPYWMNTITWKDSGIKVYRWLIFGWTIKHNG